MTEEKPERSTGLTPAQVVGSALAAVSAALLASFAGTTGTIIGAAVGSVVATVGSAAYTWWLRRTSDVVRRTAAQVRQTALLTGPLPRTVAQGPLRTDDDGHETIDPAAVGKKDEGRSGLPWGKVLLASAAVMVAALGGITTVEAITGKPISSWFGGNDSGTSVGHFVGSDKKHVSKPTTRSTRKDKPTTPSRTPAPSQQVAPSQKPSSVPSTPPAQSQPPAPAASTSP